MNSSWNNDNDIYYERHRRVIHIRSPKAMILFGIIVLIFITFCAFFAFKSEINPANRSNYVETQGVVVELDDYFDSSSGEYMYTAIAEFTVDGTTYKVKENRSSSNPTPIGTHVTILYNPENPRDAVFKSANVGFVFVIILFSIFYIAGIAIIISGVRKLKRGESY